MFTGIVTAVGRIMRVAPLEVDTGALDLSDVAVGDSICVQGACLTVTSVGPRRFTADVSEETLRVTAGLDRPGEVNLEKSLVVGDRLGGHFVTGHVDGVGEVVQRQEGVVGIRAPRALSRFIAAKGSICQVRMYRSPTRRPMHGWMSVNRIRKPRVPDFQQRGHRRDRSG